VQAAEFATSPYIYYFSDKINAFIIEHADGTDTRVLGRGVMPPGVDRVDGPGWSPSGKWFAWTAEKFSYYGQTLFKKSYLISADGTHRVEIVEHLQDVGMAWSATGDTLLVTSRTEDQAQEKFTASAILIEPNQNTIITVARETFSAELWDSRLVPLWIGDRFIISDWPNTAGLTFLIGDESGVSTTKVFDHVLYERSTPSDERGYSYDYRRGASISPMGLIAYLASDALVIENLLSGEKYEFAKQQDDKLEIAWSPNGDTAFLFGIHTYFVSVKSRKIYTLQIPNSPSLDDQQPLWSPNGKHALFSINRRLYFHLSTDMERLEQLPITTENLNWYWRTGSEVFIYLARTASRLTQTINFDINEKSRLTVLIDDKYNSNPQLKPSPNMQTMLYITEGPTTQPV